MRLFLSSRENTIVYSGGRNSALRLGFDNGGKEYFIPGNIPEWAAAILEARITSLTLAYTQIPPTTSAVEQGSRGCWVMAGIFAGIVLCFVCSLAGFLTFTFLLASNSQ
jgi:hypothetical protein